MNPSHIKRRFHQAWAQAFGYFWLPCPLCGNEFGGHQWRDIDGKPSSIPTEPHEPGTAQGICPDCTRAGKGHRPLPPQLHH